MQDLSKLSMSELLELYKTTELTLVSLAKTIMHTLTDDERKSIFDEFCVHCGSKDTRCQCWNDE